MYVPRRERALGRRQTRGRAIVCRRGRLTPGNPLAFKASGHYAYPLGGWFLELATMAFTHVRARDPLLAYTS